MPRSGSMQFWPRKRAKKEHARIRSHVSIKEAVPLGFAGYKAGMTHVVLTDNKATSKTKGQDLVWPVTIIECPAMKVAAIRFYSFSPTLHVITDHFSPKLDKELHRRISKSKKQPKEIPAEFDDLTIMMYTTPKATGIGKKKPELFEVALGGKKEEKLEKAKELLGKEVNAGDVFKEGQLLDTHSITTGRGFQGPVKRMGIGLRSHKSEKSRRAAVLGPWKGQGHVMYRVAHAGQTGYHTRTEYNKWLLKIAKPEDVTVKGGFINYGIPKNACLIIKGSVPGPKKRLIKITYATRPDHTVPKEAPSIEKISLHSPQGT